MNNLCHEALGLDLLAPAISLPMRGCPSIVHQLILGGSAKDLAPFLLR